MKTLTTNEWIKIKDGVHPWKDRRCLVRMSDDTRVDLEWNGYYWRDPKSHIRQRYNEDSVHPTHFLIYERFFEDKEY